MTSKDQREVEILIKELATGVVKKYAKDVDFIILYGSAARGDFIKGASDIDLLVQLKREEKIAEIKEFSNKLFWKLNKKYQMGFERYLATAKSNNFIDLILGKIENKNFLYTPIFVFGPEELDWVKGKILKKDLLPAAKIFASQASIFLNFKKEGRILFGRDIRKSIKVKASFWERWKGIWIPFYLVIFSLLVFPFSKKGAVKYATKAVLWGLDLSLIYLNKLIKEKDNQVRALRKAATINFNISKISQVIKFGIRGKYYLIPEKDFDIVNESIKYKQKGFADLPAKTFSYICRCLFFIIRLNMVAIFK